MEEAGTWRGLGGGSSLCGAARCNKSILQNEKCEVQQMRENVAAGNNGGRSRTSNIACYMSKLYRGAIAPTIAEASCLYPDTTSVTLAAICFHTK